MIRIAQTLAVLGLTAALAGAFALGRYPAEALLAAAIGGIGLLSSQRRIAPPGAWTGRLIDLLFILSTAGAAWGIWRGLSPATMLLATVLALAAWDLAHFGQRLESAGRVEGRASLERGHLAQLAAASGAGLLLGLLALYLHVRLTLATGLLLGLVAVLALSRALFLARRQGS